MSTTDTPKLDASSRPKVNVSGWKKVGPQGGSNPGGIYRDDDGQRYYVKRPNGGDEATHNEVIAGAFYAALGVNTNTVMLARDGDEPGLLIASPWINNDRSAATRALYGSDDRAAEFLGKVRADFAVDAWLGNYDVIGIGPYNLVGDEAGNPLRLDPGASMMCKAMGRLKPWWGPDVSEIDDMRYGSKKSVSYSTPPYFFGSMSDDDVAQSAEKLLDITPEQINAIVLSSGLEGGVKAHLAATLITRRANILSRFGITDQGATR